MNIFHSNVSLYLLLTSNYKFNIYYETFIKKSMTVATLQPYSATSELVK